MRKLLVITAVLFIATMFSAYTAVNNIKVSGDITSTGVLRDLSMGDSDKDGNIRDKDSFLLSNIRLRIDADLTEEVSAVVRLISEEIWGENNYDDVEVDLAYLQMREFLYQPLTIIVGKQELKYGSGLIVGDPDTNRDSYLNANGLQGLADDLSLRKSFDAVRAILDFSPYTIDLIYAKVREDSDTNQRDDTNLWGLNINYKWASFNGVTEAYYFGAQNNIWYEGPVPTYLVDDQVPENQDITHVFGARVQFDPTEQLTLGIEGAYQFGNVQVEGATAPAQHLSAWAAELTAQYRFLNQYNPKLDLTYVYLSGDDDLTDDDHNAWDPMFEDQSLGEIANILFANSNCHAVKLGGSFMPREDITLGLSYTWLRLAQKTTEYSGLYNYYVGPYGRNYYDIVGKEGYLGSEIDAYAIYDYTEDVQIKLTGAWFIPGDYFASSNDDVAYSLKGGVTVNF